MGRMKSRRFRLRSGILLVDSVSLSLSPPLSVSLTIFPLPSGWYDRWSDERFLRSERSQGNPFGTPEKQREERERHTQREREREKRERRDRAPK